jgi:hypothetical protein
VANVVGRNELMAAVFTLLAVYAALDRGSVFWSAAAMAAGVLSKENAAVRRAWSPGRGLATGALAPEARGVRRLTRPLHSS